MLLVLCYPVPTSPLNTSNQNTTSNADGWVLPPTGVARTDVVIGDFRTTHTFIVANSLSTPVILGCDFLTKHGFVIDFKNCTVSTSQPHRLQLNLQLTRTRSKSCNVLTVDDDLPQAIPSTVTHHNVLDIDLPDDVHPDLKQVIDDYKLLFTQQLGKTTVAEHFIDTGNATPVKVPPRPIPFHYAERVSQQLEDMAKEGIIRPSNSPWCAPAVYVPKSNGEIRICVDFVQLNRLTKKDSYPVPRADGPQQKLAGKSVFSKLDLRSAYWQFPMNRHSIEKTAFCPGPGYGLWEFTVMPYGLTGATQTCQRGLDDVLRDCKFCVDNYVDDCIVYSNDMGSHIQDLKLVLGKLKAAGFTLRGSKCMFGKSSVTHLGFEYSSAGVSPTLERTKSVADWPVPNSAKELRSFLGLANFYRRFVPSFADISAPLTPLTSTKVAFTWTPMHQQAFENLKDALVSPPILDYPKQTDTFALATDASDIGLGAVLSTSRGTVVEYASRALTSAEKNYTTIEKECLAIVWATRRFRHYLLGAPFTLQTDHKPLMWLQSAKESHARSQRLERWALELRAFEFTVKHRPGVENVDADSLSRHPVSLVALEPPLSFTDISTAQHSDPVLSKVLSHLQSSSARPSSNNWRWFPLRRYYQLWSQLCIQNSVLCRRVKSPSMAEEKYLIVVPQSLRKAFLTNAHDHSGHQGISHTLSSLSEIAYWVGMSSDVAHYCNHCSTCQTTKALPNHPAPLQPVIASRPWELIAVDILKVPMSARGNQYILVAQDYFSKWPFAQAMPDQKAERIVRILKDLVFTVVGPPCKLHSDQGRNFESHLLSNLCKAFKVTKSHTTPYHPMGDGLVERMNRSLLNLLRTFSQKSSDWEDHLQLLMFVYRTSKHTSTGMSPYEIIFGRNPPSIHVPELHTTAILDPQDYSTNLRQKLLEIRELVDANIVQSADRQQHYYDGRAPPKLKEGQKVLLGNPTKGKLDPRWTGPWVVLQCIDPTTVKLKMGSRKQTVHINRVRPFLEEDKDTIVSTQWSPPLFNNDNDENNLELTRESPDSSSLPTTRSGRTIRPVDYYGY